MFKIGVIFFKIRQEHEELKKRLNRQCFMTCFAFRTSGKRILCAALSIIISLDFIAAVVAADWIYMHGYSLLILPPVLAVTTAVGVFLVLAIHRFYRRIVSI